MQIIPKIPGNHKSRGIWLRQREREGGCETELDRQMSDKTATATGSDIPD